MDKDDAPPAVADIPSQEVKWQRTEAEEESEPKQSPETPPEPPTATPREIPPVIEVGKGQFLTTIPFHDGEVDCLVFSCSDHRYRFHFEALVAGLGYEDPHFIAIPGGATLIHPLVAHLGHVARGIEDLLLTVAGRFSRKPMIIIEHDDCGIYDEDRYGLAGKLVTRATGKSIAQMQKENLRKVARRLRHLHKTEIRAFFAQVVDGDDGQQHVRFEEVTF